MDFVENLGKKDKESLEDNGIVLIESYSAGFFVHISSQNREANISRPTGEC
ncbi:MAG: hypothetical protein L3J75_15560 [Methylococcaceae bacterium]|nr:hypothetical protein [Methylococcaceae bacterium]